jgi:hypothetical protein
MNDIISRRKVLGCFVAGAVASLVSACGGGGDGSGGAVDAAEVNAQKNSKSGTTTFAVTSPAQNSAATPTFTVSGTAGTAWVNVAIYSGSTKLGADVTPSGGKWSTTVNMGTLTGAQTLTVMAFSVAAGKAGGTSTSASLNVTIGAVAVTPPVSTKLPFWGVNCHYIDGGWYSQTPIAQQVALMQLIGVESCRQDMYDIGDAQTIAGLISQFAPIKVMPCYIPTYSGTTAQVYAAAYADGVAIAKLMAGKVPMIEIGNEWNLASINGNAQGNLPSQYNQASTTYYQAIQAGFCNGFRATDPTSQTQLAVNTTYVYFGWLQMIVNNTLPNGASTGYTCNFDVATWHDYATGGDMANTSTPSGNVNVLQSIKAITSKPIYFSECGGGAANESATATDAYIASQIPLMLADAQVEGTCFYELVDYTDGAFGLATSTGSIKPQGTALKNLIAANPR